MYHEGLESDIQTIRTKIVEILTGKAALPMAVVEFPNDPEAVKNQAENLRILTEYLRLGKPWPIVITNGDSSPFPTQLSDQHNDGKTV